MRVPFLSIILLFCLPLTALADDLTVLPETLPGDIPPAKMLYSHLMAKAYAAFEKNQAAYEAMKTPEEIEAYQKRMKEFFLDRIGEFPEKTPLNAKTVGKEQRDGYRIEKVLFESRPGVFVSAILYLPEAEPPYPGVLVPCGHSPNGKARDLYQRAPILIAKNGMAALCFDPIEQGERIQLFKEDGKPYAASVFAHQMIGVGSTLVGRDTAHFRIWDSIRALDYLASRPEVDPQRLGCTGISGGGTETAYLMALDNRVLAAAPGCYITSFKRLLETIGPQDAEQCISGQIAFGMDHADYIMMRAPKPTLVMTTTDDFFDITGAWDSYRMAKRLYEKLRRSENVDIFEMPGEHGFPLEMRVAACRWMRRWLLDEHDPIWEEDFPVAKDEDVWCAPEGKVMNLPGARTTYDVNIEYEKVLAKQRAALWAQGKEAALAKVRELTGIRTDVPAPEVRIVATIETQDYRLDKLILKPEEDVFLPALAFVPKDRTGDAVLYLHEDGKAADAGPEGPIAKLVAEGKLVLAVDLSGIGETVVSKKVEYANHVGPDWRESYLADMLGTSILAMRAEEILGATAFLAEYEKTDAPNPVHLISVGRTGPPALHAAALSPDRFAAVTLRRCLKSWVDVVRMPKSIRQRVNAVHGALTAYDLPDLLGTLPKEKVTIEEPASATGEPLP